MRSTTHLRAIARIAATALATLALSAPAATARPVVDPPTKAPTALDLAAYDATPAQSPAASTASHDGFDWGSAGVGAAAVGGLVLIAAGGFSAAQRGIHTAR